MFRKRSPTDRAAESPRIDDLKLINGIGPAVEKRLNGVSIFTFAKLAALSPADIAAAIADLTGLSSERIIKQDWIGQARKLAAEAVASEAQRDAEAPVEPPAPLERAQVAAHPVERQQADKLAEAVASEAQRDAETPAEPQQAHQLTTEAVASEAQKDIEAPAVTEQVTTFTASVEPTASIEQAQAATLSGEPEKDAAPSMKRYRPATFTIEFLLDEDNNVHSMHVLHVQSRLEDTWTGWQKTQLVDFLNQSAGLTIPSDEPVNIEEPDHEPAAVEEPINIEEPDHTPAVVTKSEPLTLLAAKASLTGTLRGRTMEVIEVESGGPCRTLIHNKLFDVHLTLDLTEFQAPGNTPLNYKASIYGKERGGPSGLVVGEAQGTIIPADTVTIKVEGNSLPEGIYHLAGTVIIGLPGMKLVVMPGTIAVIDGGKVQVL